MRVVATVAASTVVFFFVAALNLVATAPIAALALEALARLARSRSVPASGPVCPAPLPVGPLWQWVVASSGWVIGGLLVANAAP